MSYYFKRRKSLASKEGNPGLNFDRNERFLYTKLPMCVPLCQSFQDEFIEQMSRGLTTTDLSIPQLKDRWLKSIELHNPGKRSTFFGCSFENFLRAFIIGRNEHLLLGAPVLQIEFPLSLLNDSHVHFIQSDDKNSAHLNLEQIKEWCNKNEHLKSQLWFLLQESDAETYWNASKLHQVKELQSTCGFKIIRSESRVAPEDSLLTILPDNSFIYKDPFACTVGAEWGLNYWSVPGTWIAGLEDQLSELLYEMEAPHSLERLALHALWKHRDEQESLIQKWLVVTKLLQGAVSELIGSTNVRIKLQKNPLLLVMDLDAYRVQFGRKNAFTNEEVFELIRKESAVELVPARKMGVLSTSMIFAMHLTNFKHPEWIREANLEQIDESFLYKHFWDTIDGAQKLMRFLNGL
ncbi:MAG: hypothetical protein GC180_05670 [Bacteroidetes bacterium]|nr:hypothetical protein [Bacteroidota bacterium]